MHRLTLDIKDDVYNNILYFLKNLSNDVTILNIQTVDENSKKTSSSLRGIFNKYADESKIEREGSIFQKSVVKNYQKDNS